MDATTRERIERRLHLAPAPEDVRRVLPAALHAPADPPHAAPLNALTRARIRRLLVVAFGEFPTLDLHLALLDTRGAWYAAQAVGAWTLQAGGDTFFGLVRHIVRTQLPGPAPDPDIEAWLAAGRPDGWLGPAWDEINQLRYWAERRVPTTPRIESPTPAVARVDEILTDWPAEQFEAFLRAYVKLEHVLEHREIVIPAIRD